MSFMVGFLLGIFVGAMCGFGVAILAGSLASQELDTLTEEERGESDAEAVVGFFVLVLLVWLGLWALSGWALPL